ncbi:CC_3452 family protein [Aurantiacibacter flavus]|uniref:Secreted protein n=1 Tax=Aurantiacibacter flavus TaxID=3145232 RepID=A0ABV0D2P2_9SPHN
MTRRAHLIALSALTLAFAAAPQTALMAQPQGSGAFYVAEIATPMDATRMAAGGVAWACEGTSCVASRGTARPLRICHELKRKAGAITRFTVDGEPLADEQLARCNA